MNFNLDERKFLLGSPVARGVLKHSPEDFFVNEIIDFEPSGEGEHLFIRVRKKNLNTAYCVRFLATILETKEVNVGYSGLKDRHALTIQWLSIPCPIKIASETVIEKIKAEQNKWLRDGESFDIIDVKRHDRKLKRGVHRANAFEVTLKQVSDVQDVKARLDKIKRTGFPNYFGEQRYGIRCGNLAKFNAWASTNKKPKGRFDKGMILSSGRSWLFDTILSNRLVADLPLTPKSVDYYFLGDSNSLFLATQNEVICQRHQASEIHIAGSLAGQSSPSSFMLSHELESLDYYTQWLAFLVNQRMTVMKRRLFVSPQDFTYEIEGDTVKLAFTLPSGCFATSLIRELLVLRPSDENTTIER